MTKMVELVIDEQALRQKLRYAFANHDTAVQELIQNARRAGASKVDITYNPGTLELVVRDDGAGVEDFAVLMRAGVSGWDRTVADAEKPYGLGFLAAIYAAKHVVVTSRGQCLAFDTSEAIDRGQFAVVEAPTAPGTTINLQGFAWKSPESAARDMARGYPIPITYNGEELSRPDAPSEQAQLTPVGSVSLCAGTYQGESARIYLQGFMVKDSRRHVLPGAIVHLDTTRFLGKFPDRNVVIDQDEMVRAVDEQVRHLYEVRLADMREKLDPLAFCEQAHALAASLGQLAIFDDIDVAPGQWFQEITKEPHFTWDWETYTGDLPKGQVVRKADVEAGTVRVCNLDTFDPSEGGNQLLWFFAWRDNQLVLSASLSPNHWLVKLADLQFSTDVTMSVVGTGKREAIPCRTACIWGDIQLCESVEVTANGRTVRITDSPIATLIEDSPVIYVPCVSGECVYPEPDTLKQVCAYIGELDMALEGDLESDTDIVCAKVLDMITESPAERAALAIERAIRHIDELRGIACRLVIEANGQVKVSAFERH